MYGATDPRSNLVQAPSVAKVPTSFKGAEIGRWYEDPPQVDSAVEQSWYMRGQSMLVAYTKAKPGCVLARDDQPDEYMVLLPAKETVVEIAASRNVKPTQIALAWCLAKPVMTSPIIGPVHTPDW